MTISTAITNQTFLADEDFWQKVQHVTGDRVSYKFANLPDEFGKWIQLLAFTEFASSYIDSMLTNSNDRNTLLDLKSEWSKRILASLPELLTDIEQA